MAFSDPCVTLSLDPIERAIYIAGFADGLAACSEHHARTNACYSRSFRIMDERAADNVHSWLVRCGLPSNEAAASGADVFRAILDLQKKPPAQERTGD